MVEPGKLGTASTPPTLLQSRIFVIGNPTKVSHGRTLFGPEALSRGTSGEPPGWIYTRNDSGHDGHNEGLEQGFRRHSEAERPPEGSLVDDVDKDDGQYQSQGDGERTCDSAHRASLEREQTPELSRR